MTKLSFLFLLSLFTRAENITASRSVSVFSGRLAAMCSEMGSDYLEQIRRLHRLKERLKFADENLKADVRDISERLNRLARPEWNSEIYDLELRWYLPPLGQTGEIELEHAYFLEEPNEDIRRDFYIPFQPLNRPVLLLYRKKATALELCQMLPTLEFVIKTKFIRKTLGSYEEMTERTFHLLTERRESAD